MGKHTPGPWSADDLCVTRGGVQHARVYPTGPATPESGERAYADARLISAAPDMAEALSALMKQYESQMHSECDFPGDPWTPERDDDQVFLNAQAALKKAGVAP